MVPVPMALYYLGFQAFIISEAVNLTKVSVLSNLALLSVHNVFSLQAAHLLKAEVCLSFLILLLYQVDRSGSIPRLRFRDRESYAGNKTKEYDDLAMKYLSYVLFLLVACSSAYSLKYERHKSWYSWILSSLTSCVYMFGKRINAVT